MRRIVALLLIAILLLAGTGLVAAADNTVTVYVDGVKVQFPDQKAIINADNRTLVPVRFVSQALGADVEWLDNSREVMVEQKGQSIRLGIGNKFALIGGTKTVTFDTTASIINSRTMVPLRFVSECLKAQVEWKEAERAVYITTNDSGEVSDQSLVESNLLISTYPDSKPSDLEVIVVYGRDSVEPQLKDVEKLLRKRFGDKAQEVVDYYRTKTDHRNRIYDKAWVIDGKNVDVTDNGGSMTIRVWG